MKTIATGLACGLLVAAAPAAAIDFFFDGYGGFVEGSQTESPFPAPDFFGGRDLRDPNNQVLDDGADAWSGFRWGTGPLPNSSAGLIAFENNALTVEGSAVPFGQMEHDNQVINEWWEPGNFSGVNNEGPAQIKISWNLDLYDNLMDAQNGTNAILMKEYEFTLNFFETFNFPDIDDCTTPLAGFDRDYVTNCDDLFYLSEVQQDDDDPVTVGSDGVFSLEDTFIYDSQELTVRIDGFYEPINPSDPVNSPFALKGPHWSCEGGFPGSGAPCTTRWKVQVIPEPGTAWLAGLGLAALGWRRRSRAA